MTKLLFVLIFALLVEAIGVVFLSRGLKQIGDVPQASAAEIARILRQGATNRSILLGVALEAVFFGALLYLLSQRDISLIWPLTSLGFVLTTLAAKFLQGEEVSWIRWSGVLLIMVGAALVGYSESLKAQPPRPSPQISHTG